MKYDDTIPRCRGCGKKLNGSPYWAGGSAYDPVTGKQAKACYYGGWVCCYNCDFKACLELEQSMPGHGISQKSLGCFAENRLKKNWS